MKQSWQINVKLFSVCCLQKKGKADSHQLFVSSSNFSDFKFKVSSLFLDFCNFAFLKKNLHHTPFQVMNWRVLEKLDNFFTTSSHRLTLSPVSLSEAEEGAPSTSRPVSQIRIRIVWAGFEAVWPPDTTSAWCPTTAAQQSCLRALPQATGVTEECKQQPKTELLRSVQRVKHPALVSLFFSLYLSVTARLMWMWYINR